MIRWAVTTGSETSLDSFPPSNRPESALNRFLRAHFYKRRFGLYESTYLSRFEKCDLGRFRGILKKNRLKQFQIENDSQKGGTIPSKCVTNPILRFWFFIVQGIGLPESFFLNVHIFTQQPSKTWPKKACQLTQDPFRNHNRLNNAGSLRVSLNTSPGSDHEIAWAGSSARLAGRYWSFRPRSTRLITNSVGDRGVENRLRLRVDRVQISPGPPQTQSDSHYDSARSLNASAQLFKRVLQTLVRSHIKLKARLRQKTSHRLDVVVLRADSPLQVLWTNRKRDKSVPHRPQTKRSRYSLDQSILEPVNVDLPNPVAVMTRGGDLLWKKILEQRPKQQDKLPDHLNIILRNNRN